MTEDVVKIEGVLFLYTYEYAHKKSRRGCSSQTDEAMESILEGIPGKNQPTLNGKNSGEIDQNLSWTS
ncbi:hypothetical protein HUJ05_002083 [Dendroctonus ponderosae]|nr:hypothetical protein HUJ05_002083 [Dendroctonus ponderosae]